MQDTQLQYLSLMWLTPSVPAVTEPFLAADVEACKSDLGHILALMGPCSSSRQTEVSVDIAIAFAAIYIAATYFLLIRKLRSYRRQAYTVVQVGIVYNTLQVAPCHPSRASFFPAACIDLLYCSAAAAAAAAYLPLLVLLELQSL